MPLIEEVLDQLEGSRVFASLDLKNAYFHVPVEENSIKYLAFVTHEGHYEFLKTSFGLCTSANVFQRYIFAVFRELLSEKVLVIYMEDIIIQSRTEEEGLIRLERVLRVAAEYGLQINFKKLIFSKD